MPRGRLEDLDGWRTAADLGDRGETPLAQDGESR
jgi:hypothetical protein